MTMSPTSADRRTLLARFLGSATALAACRPKSSAALVVYDPANHAENLIQTAQSLYAEIQREVTNQAVMFTAQERTSVGSGKSVSVRVDMGGPRIIKKKKQQEN